MFSLFTNTLNQIDNEAPSYSLEKDAARKRVLYTLVTIVLSLFLVEYLKLRTYFDGFINLIDDEPVDFNVNDSLRYHPFIDLMAYGW